MGTRGALMRRLADWLGDFLSRPLRDFDPPAAYSAAQLTAVLQPGDVLLVEGNLRISSLIKVITRSTWSHGALYVGPQPGGDPDDPPCLVEAELGEGVILSPLSKYATFHTRSAAQSGSSPTTASGSSSTHCRASATATISRTSSTSRGCASRAIRSPRS